MISPELTAIVPTRKNTPRRVLVAVVGAILLGTSAGAKPIARPAETNPVVRGSEGPPSISRYISETEFDRLFPQRDPLYSYSALLEAGSAFPVAFSVGSETTRRRELAAFLANVSHETSNMKLIREANTANWPLYCDPSNHPCLPGRHYYGRGPIQLSWNYNYAAAGAALGFDLSGDPDLVVSDSVVAWKTALWFWTTQNGSGQLPAHEAMTLGEGFGETIRSINGALECGKKQGDLEFAQMQHRVELYQSLAAALGVPDGEVSGC